MDLKLRRRAIYTGMRPYFEDEALTEALQLWQSNFSDSPKFALTEFLSACCKTKELRQQRSRILISIFKSMDLPADELLEDPLDNKSEIQIAASVNNLDVDDCTLVFMRLFELLFKKLLEKEALSVRASIIKGCVHLAIDARRKAVLQDWLDEKVPHLEYAYALVEIRQVINFAYIGMCEIFGPVKADQVLAQVIKETEVMATQHNVQLCDFL